MTSPATPPTPGNLPYDGSYRHLFSHPAMVEHLLRGFVPQDWAQRLDFSTLDKRNAHYVADDLRQRSDDLVWRVRLNGERWLYVYLLMEFQSRNDDWMALRLLGYVGLLYQDLVKTGEVKRPGELPPVFPLVLYNGVRRWHAPLHMDALMAAAPGELLAYRPRLRYFVLDSLRAPRSGDANDDGNLVDGLMRLERSADPEALRRAIIHLRKHLNAPAYDSLRRAFTVYVNRVVLRRLVPKQVIPEANDLEEIDAMLAERVVEWTEKWKKEGLQEGRRKGLQEGRQEGLQEGFRTGRVSTLQALLAARFGEPTPTWVEERLATATDAELRAWTLAILSAQSLEDVFASSTS